MNTIFCLILSILATSTFANRCFSQCYTNTVSQPQNISTQQIMATCIDQCTPMCFSLCYNSQLDSLPNGGEKELTHLCDKKCAGEMETAASMLASKEKSALKPLRQIPREESETKAHQCVVDVSTIIADLGPLPSIIRRRNLPTVIGYLKDIILKVREGVQTCEGVDLLQAIVYVQEQIPDRYRHCYRNSLVVLFKGKKIMEFWKNHKTKKIRRELPDFTLDVKDAYDTCKEAMGLEVVDEIDQADKRD